MAEDAIKETMNEKPQKTAKENKSKKSNGFLKFFRDLKGEFKKIVWPSKKQIINNTVIVIAAILVVGVFIWLVDLGLAELVKLFLGNA
ncbi:MAG: preprotein translocase subunit SecE [Ruminococcaceae bacterium]|nr:preprotein translocase subunit SecE [Oscillospiraceae bacterium]